jgi:hypothetical protein
MTPRAIRLVLVAALLLLRGGVATLGAGSPVIRGSLGAVLTSAFVYVVIQCLRPSPSRYTTLLALGASCLIELGQWFHLAAHLGASPGGVLTVLIGSTYSLVDLGMYALGCLGAGWIDPVAGCTRLPVHPGSAS